MDALQRCLRLPEALVCEIWQLHLSATERLRLQLAWRLEAYDREHTASRRVPQVVQQPCNQDGSRTSPPLWLRMEVPWVMRETVALLGDQRHADMEWADLHVWQALLPASSPDECLYLKISTVHCREIGRLGEATWCVYGARVHPRPPRRAWLIGAPMSGWKKRLCNELVTKVLGDQFRFRQNVRAS